MSAKTHTHVSNREKPRKRKEKDKKVFFKSVLDNPFRIRWPNVPVNLQNLIYAHIVTLLEDLSSYNQQRNKTTRKRKDEARSEHDSRKKRKLDNAKAGDHSATSNTDAMEKEPAAEELKTDASMPALSKSPPRILQHLVVGINAVTKRLERQIQQSRRSITLSTSEPPPPDAQLPVIKYLFVCRADVDPPILIDHLPHLVASYNSCKPAEAIKLIPLPKGAELILAGCLNVRRVAVFAFDNLTEELQTLSTMCDSVPSLTAAWLAGAPSIVPTHIKQVKTTAPQNMKAAKEERNANRAAANQKKKDAKQKGKATEKNS